MATNNLEKSSSQKEQLKFKWRKKIVTVVTALGLTLNSCDNMPNDEVRLNPEDQSAKFKVEYHHSLWSAWADVTKYEIFVQKQWDTYMWLINQKNDFSKKKTKIEADNLDKVFDEISRTLDTESVTENTINKKNKKIRFVKKEYEDKVLNNENPTEQWEIKLKYKPE